MNPLADHQVVVVGDAKDGALARLLASLGASVCPVSLSDLDTVIEQASFIIDGLGLARLEQSEWPRARIESRNPRAIHVSVTAFGSVGPRARWAGGELVASAMGGTLNLTGSPDRAPVKEALDACWFHAEMVAAAGAMAAHYERGATGLGQHVDVAVQEVAFSRNINSILVWQFDRRKLHRVGGALNYGLATVRCIWRLADGYCFHTLMTGRLGAPANAALSEWMDEAGSDNPLRSVDWAAYNRSTLDKLRRAEWESAIAAFFASRTRAEVAGEGRRRGINATVICEPSDVLADRHLEERQFWRSTDGIRVPGRFVGMTAGAAACTDARPAAAATRTGPLAGIRVLDFSWALVGSITTKTLGDLGADVVKVESRSRPCLSRIDVQVAASKIGNFDDKPWFAHLNSSKRSLALDMKRAESREVLEPLIRWADVVVENFSPGTMAKLGLDYPRLCRINPNIVMVSGSVYGQTGPYSKEWGVDGTGAALSGRTYLTGWPDRDPVIPGAVPYGDVIVPYVMAAATAAALQARRAGGGGAHIDASMYEICVQQTYASILQAQRGLRPERLGNLDPRVFLQGVYPVAGEDRWIAISCEGPEDWERLRAFAQLGEAADPAERDRLVGGWTAVQDGHRLVTLLQAAGVAAGMVQDIEDLLEHDPQIAARGSLIDLPHPLLGSFGHVRTPMLFSRSLLAPFRAPALGEHSREIANTLAGLGSERLDELEDLGVFQ